ncbi:MAG: hypothetical protein LBF22_07565 [Deltaproteobacteria bacterium]|jgi:hypothetical protein|nr:hypothetical protein [Deltaproteobacteria bacterium]
MKKENPLSVKLPPGLSGRIVHPLLGEINMKVMENGEIAFLERDIERMLAIPEEEVLEYIYEKHPEAIKFLPPGLQPSRH